MVGPMTGQYASFGAQMKNGAELAVEDINAAGGVLGKKLDLDRRRCLRSETGGGGRQPDDRQGRSTRRRPLLLGLLDPRLARSMPRATWCRSRRPPPIRPSPTTAPDPTSIAYAAATISKAASPATYLAKHFADKNIAIVHDKTAYGKGLADETKKALNAAGKQEAMYEAITAGEKDYSALVSKLKQANIDVLFLGGYHTEAGLIVRQMRDQGMATILMGGDALITQEYWSITGPAGEGTLMTFSPDPRKNPAAAEVVKRFKDKGIEPEGYVLYTYAAIQAWKQAAEKAKSTASADVVKALNDTEFDTVIGKFKFNEKGDPNLPPYAVYRWSNGTYEEIGEQAPHGLERRRPSASSPARSSALNSASSSFSSRTRSSGSGRPKARISFSFSLIWR